MKTLLAAVLVCASQALAESGPVTLESLLSEMTDRSAIARLPSPAFTCKQFSSYDRKSVSPTDVAGWFANGDVNQYIRSEEVPAPTAADPNAKRREWVMADVDGPGAVVRIWSANPKGNIRVYLDGSPKPVIEGPMTDWLSGKAGVPTPLSHEVSKGWNLYLPIPYAKHCKITSDSDGFYYQINYRTYDAKAAVRSTTADEIKQLGKQIGEVGKTLVAPQPAPPAAAVGAPPLVNTRTSPPVVIKGGTDFEFNVGGPASGAVTNLTVNVQAADLAAALRSTVIVGEFDGKQTIWCPLGDFFGSGVGANAYQDWYRTVASDGTMSSRWVMPYQKSGKFTLQNLGDKDITATITLTSTPWTWDDRSMHFHATWRHEFPIRTKGGAGAADWNYIDIQGQGVYVGDNLAVMNPSPIWWGEGDEKIYIDGETFPSHFGTGTEDYYGYAWCWAEPFENPFHAQPRCDGWKATRTPSNYGHTTVSRVRLLDGIPFKKSMKFDMEIWHWKEVDEAYSATAYFYARPGATTNRTPDPKSAAAPIPQPPPPPKPFKVEHAIECESLQVVAKSKDLAIEQQMMEGWAPGKWSEETQLFVKGKGAGDFVEIAIPAPGDKPVKLTLIATKSFDYAIVQFSVNGQKVGQPIDFFSGAANKVELSGPIELGTFTPANGKLLLKAEITGANAKSMNSKSFFGLDYVLLK